MPWQMVSGAECATLRIAQNVEGDEFNNIAFLLSEMESIKQIFAAEGFDTLTYLAVEPG